MTLDEKLDQLAARGDGQITVAPQAGQDLESFQAVVSQVRRYESQGFVQILSEHKESRTGKRYVDRLRIRLTEIGIKWRNQRG